MDHHQPTIINPKHPHHHNQLLPCFFFFFPLINKHIFYAISLLVIAISSLFLFNLLGPFDPHKIFRFGFFSYNQKSVPEGGCNYYHGKWVRYESYKNQSYTEDCPFLDPGFRCYLSGRKDSEYLNWRWQPYGCDIPRFNATEFLERSRNGRIVFAGDSIGRNQWESFLCMLAQGVSNKSTIYEVNGNPITKHKGFLSMRFSQHNLTVEYYRAPFLVLIGRPPKNSSVDVKMTVKVDQLHWFSKKWEGADVLVFNGGHWWNDDKTFKMGCYFEERGEVNKSMTAIEGFQRSLQTWKSWANENLSRERSHIFFRGYSPAHYRNGTWNEGGQCDADTEPQTNTTILEPEPINNRFISDVIKQMEYDSMKVQFLNITYLTEFRFDGHPSLHREPGTPPNAPQDCSHWCLPGVPDTWNEILYAHLLSMGFTIK